MRDGPQSRFLTRCLAAFESATDIFFVCEYNAGGDLFNHMVRRMTSGQGPFDEDAARTLLAEVTLGLVHLHSRGFIHRDLKVENLMLDASGHVKIIDFGLAVEIADPSQIVQTMSPSGSLSYMPPELLSKDIKTGGRHTDWWALGIVAYEIMSGRSPWSSVHDLAQVKTEILSSFKVLPPPHLSTTTRHLLRNLLEKDFCRRLGTMRDYEVQRAPFFSGLDWKAIENGRSAPAFEITDGQVTDPEDSRRALDKYQEKRPDEAIDMAGEDGMFGVCSPWFLGVDVVTRHPAVVE